MQQGTRREDHEERMSPPIQQQFSVPSSETITKKALKSDAKQKARDTKREEIQGNRHLITAMFARQVVGPRPASIPNVHTKFGSSTTAGETGICPTGSHQMKIWGRRRAGVVVVSENSVGVHVTESR